jgi:hypothetical protein
VPADEEFRRMYKECASNRRVVVARIATYMLDEYISSFDTETVYLWVAQSDISSVDVSVDSTERAEGFKLFCHFKRTYVACVPHLITFCKMLYVAFVPVTMGVRE